MKKHTATIDWHQTCSMYKYS